MQQAISIQQLRTKLPQICKNLQKGVRYILIRRSKPVAELRPIKEYSLNNHQNILELFSRPPKELLKTSKKSAVKLVQEDRLE